MPLESASYISQLEVSNPAPTDLLRQSDDHLRLIKSVLKSTFPNLDGPVSSTPAQLNSLFAMPVGLISVWYGSSDTIPTGWALCNGQTANLSDGTGTIVTPDLRDRVVIGAGTVAAQGAVAGAASQSATTGTAGAHVHTSTGGSHSHTFTTDGHALTTDEMPAHKHGNGIVDDASGFVRFNHGTLAYSGGGIPIHDADSGTSTIEGYTTTEGNGTAHTHTGTTAASTLSVTSDSQGNHSHSVSVSVVQPSLGLHYIMKV